jgi:hypothetical protein
MRKFGRMVVNRLLISINFIGVLRNNGQKNYICKIKNGI